MIVNAGRRKDSSAWGMPNRIIAQASRGNGGELRALCVTCACASIASISLNSSIASIEKDPDRSFVQSYGRFVPCTSNRQHFLPI